jgi:group I intron endonuclease
MKNNLIKEDAEKIGVYIIHNPHTGHAYIGSGLLQKRCSRHTFELEHGCHTNSRLQRAYNKDPRFEFIGLPVEDHSTKEENKLLSLQIEQSMLDDHFGDKRLLNIQPHVTSPTGAVRTDETKERMRDSANARWQRPGEREAASESLREQYASGRVNAFRGRTQTEEAKQKIGAPKLKPIIVNGVPYDGIRPAAQQLEMKEATVRARVFSPSFPEWTFA